MPACSSSLISPALEHISGLPAGVREQLEGRCAGLLEYLAQVPDPRDPRGVRHLLTSLLLAADFFHVDCAVTWPWRNTVAGGGWSGLALVSSPW